jgi:outer membrane lipoprotein-sorting protein
MHDLKEDLTRHLEEAVPDEVNLWPRIQERLAQRQTAAAAAPVTAPAQAPSAARSTRRRPMAIAAAAAAVVLGLSITGILWPKPATAAAILGKARSAMAAPAASGTRSMVMREEVTYPTGTVTINRWYEAPDKWRVEMSAGGALKGLLVSDGTTMWRYDPAERTVSISEVGPTYETLAALAPLGEPTANLGDLLQRADQCFSARVAGTDKVAGRSAYVVNLKQTGCFSAAAPNQGGAQSLWVDKQTFLVLKSTASDAAGKQVEAREVTSVAFQEPIPADTFTFAVPQGATVYDSRPKPAPSGVELVGQMQQLAAEAGIPLYLPRAVPAGLKAGAPQRTPAGVEVNYSPNGTRALEAGTVLVIQQKAAPTDLTNPLPDEQIIQVAGQPAIFLQGNRNPDGTGLASNLTVVRNGTKITFTSFTLDKAALIAMAESLEPVTAR